MKRFNILFDFRDFRTSEFENFSSAVNSSSPCSSKEVWPVYIIASSVGEIIESFKAFNDAVAATTDLDIYLHTQKSDYHHISIHIHSILSVINKNQSTCTNLWINFRLKRLISSVINQTRNWFQYYVQFILFYGKNIPQKTFLLLENVLKSMRECQQYYKLSVEQFLKPNKYTQLEERLEEV